TRSKRDWSSDVCSSDLWWPAPPRRVSCRVRARELLQLPRRGGAGHHDFRLTQAALWDQRVEAGLERVAVAIRGNDDRDRRGLAQTGRASGRERGRTAMR